MYGLHILKIARGCNFVMYNNILDITIIMVFLSMNRVTEIDQEMGIILSASTIVIWKILCKILK
jgi:hypothetical protein